MSATQSLAASIVNWFAAEPTSDTRRTSETLAVSFVTVSASAGDALPASWLPKSHAVSGAPAPVAIRSVRPPVASGRSASTSAASGWCSRCGEGDEHAVAMAMATVM